LASSGRPTFSLASTSCSTASIWASPVSAATSLVQLSITASHEPAARVHVHQHAQRLGVAGLAGDPLGEGVAGLLGGALLAEDLDQAQGRRPLAGRGRCGGWRRCASARGRRSRSGISSAPTTS
jgi:hypothetical protein